jgi:hypothetical protein
MGNAMVAAVGIAAMLIGTAVLSRSPPDAVRACATGSNRPGAATAAAC